MTLLELIANGDEETLDTISKWLRYQQANDLLDEKIARKLEHQNWIYARVERAKGTWRGYREDLLRG